MTWGLSLLAVRFGRRIDEGTRPSGRWTVDWAGATEDGTRLAPGVYFVRMWVDGTAVERSRIVLVR